MIGFLQYNVSHKTNIRPVDRFILRDRDAGTALFAKSIMAAAASRLIHSIPWCHIWCQDRIAAFAEKKNPCVQQGLRAFLDDIDSDVWLAPLDVFASQIRWLIASDHSM